MPRSPLSFKQSDTTRMLKAAHKAGFKKAHIQKDGSVIAMADGPQESPVEPVPPSDDGVNEWDRI